MHVTELIHKTYAALKEEDWLYTSLKKANTPLSDTALYTIAETIRLAGSTPSYIKKDGRHLALSVINTETAAYLLFKTHFGHKRAYGKDKRGTPALKVPHNRQEPPKMVYQLVNRDDLAPEALLDECQTQVKLAKAGICPAILESADYVKPCKNGLLANKRALFVEQFDSDLKAFDPGQIPEVAGEDPRPFALSNEQLLFIAQTVATHLDALHQQNCVYRDLCLENVGISFDRPRQLVTKVLLCDFGTLASLEDPDYKRLPTYGHLEFTAPEYFTSHQPIDEKACDMYALGILLAMLMQPEGEEFEAWEPAWIHDFITLLEESASYSDPLDRYNFVITHDTCKAVCTEQLQYVPLAAPTPEQDNKTFLQSLIGILLHPDPKQRPTAKEVIALCTKQ